MSPLPPLPRNDQEVAAWVQGLLETAWHDRASDLHVDPCAAGGLLRLRIDGLLHDWGMIPLPWLPRLTARIKVMAQMDLSERRLPQDGRLSDPDRGSVRVATLPTLHGEKLCLRLGESGEAACLDNLSLPDNTDKALRRALGCPNGLILITGPTGAGKTTTLYACLQALNCRSRHIATIEDPIERLLPGINQTAVQPRIGLDFATVLRALLRQDPDVLMVGEIRDAATADMALQAAETGHLVLSTLHTGSALEALTRLRHLGIPDYLLADNVRLVMAQRLVRRRCPLCRPMRLSAVAEPASCMHCDAGYIGRTGLYEHLEMTPALAKSWLDNDIAQAQDMMLAGGAMTLQAHGRQLCAAGITDEEEITRVLGHAR